MALGLTQMCGERKVYKIQLHKITANKALRRENVVAIVKPNTALDSIYNLKWYQKAIEDQLDDSTIIIRPRSRC